MCVQRGMRLLKFTPQAWSELFLFVVMTGIGIKVFLLLWGEMWVCIV